MASAEEIQDAGKYFFRYVKSDWKSIHIEPFYYENTGIGPVGKSYDVFGDGSILLVNTPGHSNGLFTVIIKNDNKYVVLASDGFYTQKSIDEQLIPGFTVNKELARNSLEWLTSLTKDKNCLGVFANNDPSVQEQTINL